MQVPLTKTSVARRQLATAIELFFAGKDVVSVYSLATNAWEVIDVLCRKAGLQSFSVQARENVPQGKDLKRDYINSPHRNFFKHADKDDDLTLDSLPVSQLEGVLFMAVEDYIHLNRRSPVQLQVFQLWYLAKHPDKLSPADADELLEGINEAFPNLSLLSCEEQRIRGAEMLEGAMRNAELQSDPRTEPAFD